MKARYLLFALFAACTAIHAQSNRAYAGGPAWWNPGWGGVLPWEDSYDNPDGFSGIRNKTGSIQTKDHPFFEPLGTNGRACVTCHQPASAMSISVGTLRQRWIETSGSDPIFAAVDGSNCPDLPQKDADSHSLLLDRGLFRIVLPLPKQADFRIEVVSDPAGCNKTPGQISVYRRPRMAANLDFLLKGTAGNRVFMADGREPTLESQAINAALAHEQATSEPDKAKIEKIVEFETQIFAAQIADLRGGLVDGPGSPRLGIQQPEPLTQISFDPWRTKASGLQAEFRASAARGSDIFFKRAFLIDDVPQLAVGTGTCSTCHISGTTRWMNIGTSTHKARFESKLPVFRVTCWRTNLVYRRSRPGFNYGEMFRCRRNRAAAIPRPRCPRPLFRQRFRCGFNGRSGIL